MFNIPLLANRTGPEWLPSAAAQGREFAYWGQLVVLLMVLLLFIAGIASVLGGEYSIGAYAIIAGVVNLFIFSTMPRTVFAPLDQGRFREASDRLLIWGVLSLLFGVVGGVLLLIAFVQLQDVFQPQYQQYPPGQYYQQPQYQQPQYQQQRPAPPPYRPPQQPVQPVPPAEQPGEQPREQPTERPAAPAPAAKKAEMTKCRNCGAQYPSFMRNCPNCGAPRS